MAERVPDTDFFVQELYAFGPSLGITFIEAVNSRFVIDLNRDPEGGRLYGDQRQETSLVPVRSFGGEDIYVGTPPDSAEIEERRRLYFQPYYQAIEEQLASLKAEFGYALFWDCHSIKRRVPTFQDAPFPDALLGTQHRRT